MKFKKDKENELVKLVVADKSGDELHIKRFNDDVGSVYFYINDGVGVRLTRGKALKLAYAIADELGPL